MDGFSRRTVLAAMVATPAIALEAPQRVKMLLNSGWSGANAWFVLAEDRGYLRDEGIAMEFTAGRGAYTAAPRMFAEGHDIGYGDINSLTELVAMHPGVAPVGVYMMFNASPSGIVVAADGSIRTAKQLEGRRIAGHPTDVALGTFPAFAKAVGVDAGKVRVVPSDAAMIDLVKDLLAGRSDGVFGYFTTQTAAAMTAGLDPETLLRFLRFDAVLPDFYGSALMASAAMVRDRPAVVAGFVRAMHRGVVDAIRDPDAAIAAVMQRDAKLDPRVERARLMGTLQREMAHPERQALGLGDVDDARLGRSIAMMAGTKPLGRTPEVREVFVREFLPDKAIRLV